MRIKAFSHFIENYGTKDYSFKDSAVVIDAYNYFYSMYERSQLPFKFGCESDRFAEFLKEDLRKFKNANLRCYFVFKGANEKIETKFKKAKIFFEVEHKVGVPRPTFCQSIWKQVLDEMKFNYVTCPLEAKDYCITLAKKLKCPIISQDMQYALSVVPYIPQKQMSYDHQTNAFTCIKYNKEETYKKFKLNEAKFIIFIVLTDIDGFPENHFINFFKANRMMYGNYERILRLLWWLSSVSENEAVKKIFKFLDNEGQRKFLESQRKTAIFLKHKNTGLPSNLFFYSDSMRITKNDPKWAEKGVLNNFIGKPYSFLYFSNLFIFESYENDTRILIIADIITYAYNLLTNYTKQRLQIRNEVGALIAEIDTTILPFPKPEYKAVESVFENGWDFISSLGLFEHFLKGIMKGIDLSLLEDIPADARLLMITLVYFTIKKKNETLDEIYTMLLSYIMLGVVFEDGNRNGITKTDCEFAINATKTYFQLDASEVELISDKEMTNSLFEFQYCLEQMNYLNILCGFSFIPTIYSKTYNGTFVYKIFYELRTKGLDRNAFYVDIFEYAPTVFLFLQDLVERYKRLVSSIEK